MSMHRGKNTIYLSSFFTGNNKVFPVCFGEKTPWLKGGKKFSHGEDFATVFYPIPSPKGPFRHVRQKIGPRKIGQYRRQRLVFAIQPQAVLYPRYG